MTISSVSGGMGKQELVLLHSMLGQLELHIARQSTPSRWEGDDLEAVREVQEIIENLTN